MSKEKYLFLGSIKKTYGVTGALIIQTTGRDFRFKKTWEAVFIKIDGILVPFFIESREQADSSTFIIKIDQFNDKDTASRYIHLETYILQKDLLSCQEAFDGAFVEGFTIRDIKTGETGIIKQYLFIKNNPLFLVSVRQKEFYIPANPAIITRMDNKNKIVFITLPEGLADSQKS